LSYASMSSRRQGGTRQNEAALYGSPATASTPSPRADSDTAPVRFLQAALCARHRGSTHPICFNDEGDETVEAGPSPRFCKRTSYEDFRVKSSHLYPPSTPSGSPPPREMERTRVLAPLDPLGRAGSRAPEPGPGGLGVTIVTKRGWSRSGAEGRGPEPTSGEVPTRASCGEVPTRAS